MNAQGPTSPQEKIQSELAAAMKASDKERTSTLRMLLTALKNERIAQGEEIDEAGFLKIVQKSIKQRRESAELYDKGGRDELAAKERGEIEILEAYLPEQAGQDEIRSAIEAFVADNDLAGPQAIGQVMKAMMARFAGSADGSVVSRIAREVLTG